MPYSKTKDGWSFQLHNIKFTAKKIGVVYDSSDSGCVLLKHGPLEDMMAYQKITKYLYESSKKYNIADSIKIVDASNAMEADLNDILESSALPEKAFLALQTLEIRKKPIEQGPAI